MANLFTNPSQAGFACTTVVDLLRFQGQQQPNQSAFTFLSEGQTESMIMTYEALDRSSRAIAAQLQAMGLQGERALLLYPPGLDYLAAFFGCLYAGVVAIPAYPPRNKRNTPRILAILEDAQAAIALTTTGIENNVRSLLTNKVASVQWLTTDNLPLELATQWQEPRLSGESLAFLQYTSGSTGTPKGVMITHGNLLHNAARTYQYMEHSPESVFVSWLPAYHDMGLIGGILQPLYGGFPCILMSPTYFLQRPFRWLEAISRYGGTTSGAPNFAYELCVQKVTPEQRETLDLSRWDVAFNGAEPIRHQVLEDFAEYFAPCGFRREAFYPCYGMAEATLMVSGVEKAAAPIIKVVDKDALAQNRVVKWYNNSVSLVSCGRSLPDQQVIIANPDTLTRCEAGEVGEIWVTGPSVGKGYWNRPNATQETFQAYLAETGEGPFLRTGDLGFLENGELYVTGRAKDLIIIRGRNLYPQDIEFTAENSHPALRATGSAAFAVDVEGEERLVVVQELAFRHKADLNEVIREIRQAIAIEHEIQPYGIVLIKGGTIPKTSSGKIQRRACRSQFLAGMLTIEQCSIVEAKEAVKATISLNRKELLSLETEKQQEELEAYLKDSITVALQCSVAEMNWESPLMALGLDSLRVFQLKNAIETDLEVEIAIADLFSEMTLTELAANLLEKMRETVVSGSRISRCTPQADYPLSDAQKRLWFFDRFQPNTALYNIAGAYHLKGQVNITALEQSLNEIVRCQDSLRTYFKVVNGEARQAIASFVPLLLPILDLQNVTKEQQTQVINEEIQTPFDLGIAPLIRVKLLQLSPTHFILTVVIHHIISDGWSMGIFLQDLMGLYDSFSRGKTPQLKSLPIQYRDYAVWESQSLDNSSIHLNYWKEKLAGKLPILALPTDYPRPTVATFKGARQKQIFSQELATQLKSLSQQNGVTLYMTLLAAFKTLLYRYTGQTDLLVGSPIAGRNYRETNSLIGFFVNTLVLRTELSGEIRFTDYLQTVKETALEAYSHAAMPFEQLVQALQPTRELSHSPLFQVMFALQNMPMLSQMPSGLTGYYEELDTQTAKFDLTLFMAETKAGLSATFEYNTDLFKPETIDRMLGHFRVLLEGIVANSNQSIAKLPLLTVAEEKQLAEWNQTEVNYPLNICLHSLVEEQVEKTPNAIAVVYDHPGVETRHGASLQYRELNAKANQLAHYLQSLGVKPDTLVGVCLQRSPLMIIALLAILKAGGAYLPLDPTYPKERLAFMLTDAKVSVLLTESSCLDSLPVSDSSICLDSDWETISQYSTENPSSEVTADNIAYTIYTSGSTGNPKGAMNTHRGIVNRLLWMRDAYEVGESDRILQKTPFSFDVSVWEFFLPLI
ncbi:MAG: AMP-binding protein, partial [Chroococcales cyanobacterium]